MFGTRAVGPSRDREATSSLISASRMAGGFIGAVLNVAVQDGAIGRSPGQIPGAGTQGAPEREIATPAEVAALIDATTPRFRAAVTLAAWCCLRRGEICALRVTDVDLDNQRVTVRKNYVELLETPRSCLLYTSRCV